MIVSPDGGGNSRKRGNFSKETGLLGEILKWVIFHRGRTDGTAKRNVSIGDVHLDGISR